LRHRPARARRERRSRQSDRLHRVTVLAPVRPPAVTVTVVAGMRAGADVAERIVLILGPRGTLEVEPRRPGVPEVQT